MSTVTYLISLFAGIETPIPEFAGLCSKLLGPIWEHVCAVFSLLAVLGAAIVYWVLMSNFLFNSVDFFIGKQIMLMQQTIDQ